MTKVNDNWYEHFFQGINCELWENAIPPVLTQQEVEFLFTEMNLEAGQHILDIPCGFGRHAVEFAKRGLHVTGIDISQTFIEGLTRRITSENLSIKAIQANILSVDINGKFSGAVCLGNSFGYFNFDKMKIFIKKVSDCLETGAKFIINSGMIAESLLPNFSNYNDHNSYTVGNITMEVTNFYFPDDSFMVSKLFYTKEGKTEEHSYKHHVFTLGEIKRLLQLYGLNVIDTYSSTSREEYKLADRQVYIVAVKE